MPTLTDPKRVASMFSYEPGVCSMYFDVSRHITIDHDRVGRITTYDNVFLGVLYDLLRVRHASPFDDVLLSRRLTTHYDVLQRITTCYGLLRRHTACDDAL